MKNDCLWAILVISILSFGLFFASATLAATYTVNSTDDSDDSTCTHPYVDASNDCTLREAINAANSAAGTDTITFSISTANFSDDGNGQFTISPSSILPTISGVVELTAVGMWDSSGTQSDRPGVRILGTSAGSGVDGIVITAGSSEVKGLKIDDFSRRGLSFTSNGSNIVGTDCDGTNDTNERNVIIRNGGPGIRFGGGNGNTVAGNYIGIDEDGSTPAGNSESPSAQPFGVTAGIESVSSNNNIIGYSSSSCSAAAQRNIISENKAEAGIKLDKSDNARISGNYIGLDATGTQNRGNIDHGIEVVLTSDNNIIGTNGDGTTDTAERNVIAGNSAQGIYLFANSSQDSSGSPRTTRISGNYIGLNAAGTAVIQNTSGDLFINTDSNIIGWCDTTVSSTMCSNNGTLADQRNIIAGSPGGSISLDNYSDSNIFYGNWIGLLADGSSAGVNSDIGITINRRASSHTIGGSSTNQRNEIAYYLDGIEVNLAVGDISSPSQSHTIENNYIHHNTAWGVDCIETLEYATVTPYEITLRSNTISNNGIGGVQLDGCSWDVQSNTIQNNTGWGLKVNAKERPDDPSNSGSLYNNPYDGLSPNNTSNDLVSRPRIQSNTIGGNSSGGIYLLDTAPTNASTLLSENTFSSNNSNPHIQQDWYGAVELLDRSNNRITSGNETIILTRSNCSTCSTQTGGSVSDAGSGSAIWGPSGTSYNNARSWFTVTDYIISSSGNLTSYNPYIISASGTYAANSATYYFDGSDNDTASVTGLSNGITTNSLYRYQIAELKASTTPSTPTNTSPTNGATGQSFTLSLSTSSFSDASNDTHASSTWRIYSTSSLCSAGSTADVLDTTSTSSLTSLSVPSQTLQQDTMYYWRVAYTNSFGNRSSFSSCTSFTTIRTTPSFSGTIPNQTWDEDSSLENAFDLDGYFSDAESETLTYSVLSTDTPDQITISINTEGLVSFSSTKDWASMDTVTFQACDTNNECISSNQVTLTVNEVNDPPEPPTGFSPANGETTALLTPEISWDAAVDIDDSAALLKYEIRLGKNSNPVEQYAFTTIMSQGDTDARITDELNDETTYYYVVRTIDPEDEKSDWSDVQEFYVNQEAVPEITLTKEIARNTTARRDSIIVYLLATPALASERTQLLFLDISPLVFLRVVQGLTVILLVLLGIALVAILQHVQNVSHIIPLFLHNVATVFARLFMQVQPHVTSVSYHRFKRRLLIARAVTISAVISLIILFWLQQSLVSSVKLIEIEAASSQTVEPGETFVVRLSYDNEGDGDATAVALNDTVPDGTAFVANSGRINSTEIEDSKFISGSTIDARLGTITDRDDTTKRSGTVSYRLLVDNPYKGGDALTLSAASLFANELAEPAVSNTLTLTVQSALISGAVTDGVSGQALADLTVSLMQSDGSVTATTQTTSDGTYTFEGLGDGSFTISVTPPSGYEETDTQSKTVEAGDVVTDVNFALQSIAGEETEEPEEPTEEEEEEEEGVSPVEETPEEEQEEEQEEEDKESPVEFPEETPEEVIEDFEDIPEFTKEEKKRKEELEESLELISIDDILVTEGVVSYITTPGTAQLPSRLVGDIQQLFLPEKIEDIVLTGKTEPSATVTIILCFEEFTQVAQADQQGTWTITIPRALLPAGEHAAVAVVEHDGIRSDPVEVARFVIADQPKPKSPPVLLLGIGIFIAVIAVNALVLLFIPKKPKAPTLSL